ncbi:MAG: CDP-glycerol glycerophosphotransferase family protein, partial [Candidatus Omnitrophica bacterium]|nr:CDP-glycerol glycerophosphotransferase family protein [Candidatus Omnitrophota bacterium]
KFFRKIKYRFYRYFLIKLIKKMIEEISPDIIIANTTKLISEYKTKAMKVLVFHSINYKKYIVIPETLKYDLVLLSGNHYKQAICDRLKPDNVNKLKVVGWPRIDDFINKKFTMQDRDEFSKRLGLNLNLKNVLYAPTWDSFDEDGLFPKSFGNTVSAFEEFCKKIKELNVNLIVRLHCETPKLTGDMRLHKIAEKYNVHFVYKRISGYLDNLAELFLWITDVLISDTSGMITDFMILNRPIIYIEPDNKNFNWEETDLPQDFRAGKIVKTLPQLITAVKESLINPQEYRAKREEILNKIFYGLDGKSSERASDTILNFYYNVFLEK